MGPWGPQAWGSHHFYGRYRIHHVIRPFRYGSIPIDTFLVGWTSIYQLFWGSLGTRVLTHNHLMNGMSPVKKYLSPLTTPGMCIPAARWRSLGFIKAACRPPPPPPPASDSALNRKLQISVGTAGPQPRAPELSGHCRTTTASTREHHISVSTAGPQPPTPDLNLRWRTSTASARCQIECDKECQIECQNMCQIEHQFMGITRRLRNQLMGIFGASGPWKFSKFTTSGFTLFWWRIIIPVFDPQWFFNPPTSADFRPRHQDDPHQTNTCFTLKS